jgi:hypothetical protein
VPLEPGRTTAPQTERRVDQTAGDQLRSRWIVVEVTGFGFEDRVRQCVVLVAKARGRSHQLAECARGVQVERGPIVLGQGEG